MGRRAGILRDRIASKGTGLPTLTRGSGQLTRKGMKMALRQTEVPAKIDFGHTQRSLDDATCMSSRQRLR